MAKTSEVTLKGMKFEIYSLTGEVKDSRKWTSTEVSGEGGGGGGYVQGGSGYVSTQPVNITSTTTTHDQLFVQGSDGKEICVETSNANLQVRPGHIVSVVWGIKKGKDQGYYWTIFNHNTEKTNWLDVSSSFSPRFFGQGRFWWIMAVLVGVFGALGMVGATRDIDPVFINAEKIDSDIAFRVFLAGILMGVWTLWIQLRIRGRAKQFKKHFASKILPLLIENTGEVVA
ncbi:MAG: hypothetical protein AAB433_22090 [Nitrospirota bacterium]